MATVSNPRSFERKLFASIPAKIWWETRLPLGSDGPEDDKELRRPPPNRGDKKQVNPDFIIPDYLPSSTI